MRAWLYMILAIFFEVGGTTALKLSHGLARPWPVAGVVLSYGLSFAFLAFALKSLPVSIAYALWSAVGTVAIAVIGMGFFGEPVTAARIFFLGVIVFGVTGLHLVSA